MSTTDVLHREPAARQKVAAFGVVALLSFLVYLPSAVATNFDSVWTMHVARSLLVDGDVDLSEYRTLIVEENDGWKTVDADRGLYSDYPVAVSVAALPVVAAYEFIGPWFGYSLEDELREGEVPEVERTAAALIAALGAGLTALLGFEMTGSRHVALAAGLLVAFGTSLWSTAALAMWQHGPSVACGAAALWWAVRVDRGKAAAWPLGPLLVVAYAIRPTNAVMLIAFSAWVLIAQREHARMFVAAGVAAGAVLGLGNLALYGEVVPRYFAANRLELSGQMVEALAGNLVSPARGLLVFSPFVVLGVVGYLRKPRESLDYVALAIMAGHWVGVSAFPHWWGGWSFGPRFMSDVLPFVMWFVVPVIATVISAARRDHLLLKAAFVVLAAVSVAIHARGATAIETEQWNYKPNNVDRHPDRLWDWTDLQFWRGL